LQKGNERPKNRPELRKGGEKLEQTDEQAKNGLRPSPQAGGDLPDQLVRNLLLDARALEQGQGRQGSPPIEKDAGSGREAGALPGSRYTHPSGDCARSTCSTTLAGMDVM